MKKIIDEILRLAVNAPSGHNSQPWKFVVKESDIFIYNVPDKDKILFNYEQRGSMIAHGALIENIFIIASEKGYRTNLEIFPAENEPDLVAKVNLTKSGDNYSHKHLFPFILKRTTNRKPFKEVALNREDSGKLEEFLKTVEGGFKITFTQNKEKIAQLASALSTGDRLIFENIFVHKSLFSNVNWTLKEEQEKQEGLYIGTKELSLFNKILFKYLLSNWNIVNKLNIIKLPEKAAKKREDLYRQCSVVGLILSPGDSKEDFINSGRILQRFWLTVTSLKLHFQPLSVGLLYLGQRVQKETPNELSPNQIDFIEKAYKKVKDVFGVSAKVPVFSFRIGYAPPPTASSVKKLPEIIYH